MDRKAASLVSPLTHLFVCPPTLKYLGEMTFLVTLTFNLLVVPISKPTQPSFKGFQAPRRLGEEKKERSTVSMGAFQSARQFARYVCMYGLTVSIFQLSNPSISESNGYVGRDTKAIRELQALALHRESRKKRKRTKSTQSSSIKDFLVPKKNDFFSHSRKPPVLVSRAFKQPDLVSQSSNQPIPEPQQTKTTPNDLEVFNLVLSCSAHTWDKSDLVSFLLTSKKTHVYVHTHLKYQVKVLLKEWNPSILPFTLTSTTLHDIVVQLLPQFHSIHPLSKGSSLYGVPLEYIYCSLWILQAHPNKKPWYRALHQQLHVYMLTLNKRWKNKEKKKTLLPGKKKKKVKKVHQQENTLPFLPKQPKKSAPRQEGASKTKKTPRTHNNTPIIAYTPQQASIIHHEFKDHILRVNAFAGAGKTSVLVGLARQHPNKRILYLCFNVAVQQHAEEVFPSNTTCKNVHKLAYSKVGYRYQHKLKVDEDVGSTGSSEGEKMSIQGGGSQGRGSITNIHGGGSQGGSSNTSIGKGIPTTLDKSKQGTNSTTKQVEERLSSFLHSSTLHLPLTGDLYQDEALANAWSHMTSVHHPRPMTHAGYLKLYQLSKPDLSKQYDMVMLDEAQDCNPVMLDILLRQANLCRVMCGDRHQAIYQFMGARSVFDDSLEGGFVDKELTHSFRFGNSLAGTLLGLIGIYTHVFASHPTWYQTTCTRVFNSHPT